MTEASKTAEPVAANLVALAERCEQATGADRELDALIAVALNPDCYRLPVEGDVAEYGDPLIRGDVVFLRGFIGAVGTSAKYTGSIDVATCLTPADYAYTVSFIGFPTMQADARVWLPSQKGDGVSGDCDNAATPALALCAAALRARARIAQRSQSL